MSLKLFVLACLTSVLASCGGGPSAPPASITTGNWSLTATSNASVASVLGGSFAQSGSSVFATMNAGSDTSSCLGRLSAAPFAGSFEGKNLTLTSAPINGMIVTLKATGAGNELTGNYSVEGGCAAGEQGTIEARYVQPLTGAWRGNIKNPDGTFLGTISVDLTQSSAAKNGDFPLTGVVYYDIPLPGQTSGGCVFSGTIPSDTAQASVTGNFVVISAAATSAPGCANGDITLVGTMTEASGPTLIYGVVQNMSKPFALVKIRP